MNISIFTPPPFQLTLLSYITYSSPEYKLGRLYILQKLMVSRIQKCSIHVQIFRSLADLKCYILWFYYKTPLLSHKYDKLEKVRELFQVSRRQNRIAQQVTLCL